MYKTVENKIGSSQQFHKILGLEFYYTFSSIFFRHSVGENFNELAQYKVANANSS